MNHSASQYGNGRMHAQESPVLKFIAPQALARRAALLLLPLLATGCAAFHPIDGVPVRHVPDQFLAVTRSGKQTIDLSLLRQTPPDNYRVDSGDVLGVYIEGVLGNREEAPPVYFPEDGSSAPSLGFPLPVREDGTISLPLIGKVSVRGLTTGEVEDRVRSVYVEKEQLRHDRIFVSLQRPRTYRVLVIRQEGNDSLTTGAGELNLGAIKRGTGQVVTLQAYENDVLHALALTGGPPGLDAENTIYVIRGGRRLAVPSVPAHPVSASRPAVHQASHQQSTPVTEWGFSAPQDGLPMHAPDWNAGILPGWEGFSDATIGNPSVIKIPFRLTPGDQPMFSPESIILEDGDVVFIESRDTEVFYTGGLLGGGQYVLPRDYDLDVLGAISIAQSQNSGGGAGATRATGGVSALNQDVTIGASHVVILRQVGDGRQIPIEVDLYRAMEDPSERVVIQPGDYIILRYTAMEAFGAFIERHLLEGALFGVAGAQLNNNGN